MKLCDVRRATWEVRKSALPPLTEFLDLINAAAAGDDIVMAINTSLHARRISHCPLV
jgi:hypothetical protein